MALTGLTWKSFFKSFLKRNVSKRFYCPFWHELLSWSGGLVFRNGAASAGVEHSTASSW
jgi:hypothetical protein